MKNKPFNVNFRAYYQNGNQVDHHESIQLKDIPKWIECYQFTHKECLSITVKIWLTKPE